MKASEKGRNASFNFANENCLSFKVLTSLIEIKVQLLEFLIDIGFVPGDIKIRHKKNDIQDRILFMTGPAVSIYYIDVGENLPHTQKITTRIRLLILIDSITLPKYYVYCG